MAPAAAQCGNTSSATTCAGVCVVLLGLHVSEEGRVADVAAERKVLRRGVRAGGGGDCIQVRDGLEGRQRRMRQRDKMVIQCSFLQRMIVT